MKTELENIEKMSPLKLFKPKAIGILLKAIETEVQAFVPDVETPDGRKQITSLAYKVARSKTAIDNLGKEFVATKKAEVATIDEVRRTARDFLDQLKTKVRMPLTAWEQAEEDRTTKILGKVQAIKDLGDEAGGDMVPLTSLQLNANLDKLRAIKVTKIYAEYQDEAINAKNAAIVALTELIPIAVDREVESANAAQRAAEEAENERIENEQRIAREAVEASEGEAKRELEQRDAAEAQEKADQEAREKNTRHKGEINKAAAEAIQILIGCGEADAKHLVKGIVTGKIPNVTINY